MNKDNKKAILKIFIVLFFILLAFIGLYFFSAGRLEPAFNMSARYFEEMISIFPAILLIMGLADIWIPTSYVKKYLGNNSGIKGKLLAIFLGTLPTGPMYVAFPLAGELLKKEASLSNIIIFLGVWGSLKIPQIGVEIKFIGLKFSILRFIFTLASVVIMGFIMEKLMDNDDLKEKKKSIF